jgi:hypothetical protein
VGLPAFPVAAFSPGGTKTYAPARSTSTMTGIYGTNASNALAGISTVTKATGDAISGAHLLEIANAANAERTRRGGSAITIPNGYYTGRISASRIQAIRTGLEISGPAASQAYSGAGASSSDGYYVTGTTTGIIGYDSYYGAAVYGPVTTYALLPDPSTVTFPQVSSNTGSYDYDLLYALGSRIKAVHINDLITVINNNRAQCTCNCNYCTCNCNYCTCNCNYACTCNCNYSDEQVKTQIEYM